MASREKCDEMSDRLRKNFKIPMEDRQVSTTWQTVFDGLTDKQMESGYARLVREHNSSWPPKPGQFMAFAGGGGGNNNPKGLPASCFTSRYDERQRLWVDIDKNNKLPPKRGQPALKIPGRNKQVGSGLKSPLTAEERSILLSATGPNTQQIIDIANKQRRAFGWPLLDVQGRTINV